MANHIYVGSAKERQTQYGPEIDVQLEIDDLAQYVTDYGYINKAGKHIVRIKIARRREVGRFGETHSVEVNTWKPDSSGQGYTRQGSQTPVGGPPRASQRAKEPTPEELDELNQLPIPF